MSDVPIIHKLPFTVKDEDGVEWNVRVTAFDGVVAFEQYRNEPGKRVMRDVARMSPEEAASLARGLEKMAMVACDQIVKDVHDE